MTNKSSDAGWRPYDLDYYAQELVLEFRNAKDVLNESHKMRMTIAYGLERFWGEHLRLEKEKSDKAKYWLEVWKKLHAILDEAGITLPNNSVKSILPDKEKKKEEEKQKIKKMAKDIWSMSLQDQRVALMVLTQLCDSLVWWTQRYKVEGD